VIRRRWDVAPFAVLVVLVAGILAGERVSLGSGEAPLGASAVLAIAAASVRTSRPRAARALALAAVALLGMGIVQRSLHGLTDGVLSTAAAVRSDLSIEATLVDDPEGSRFTTRALVRIDHASIDGTRQPGGSRTVLVVAESDAGPRFGLLDAGDRVTLRGWIRPLEGYDARLRWRHAMARVDAVELLDFDGPRPPHLRAANELRKVVLSGSAGLPATERGLVSGFLLGDTRAIPDPVLESFRAAGLSHLLAVSGANVAFSLALVAPMLRRLSRTLRLAATLAVLALFGAMTRWEPSVLRACVMAAVAVLAVHLGRPAQTTRVLAVAVSGLLVLDPFLVHSVGFQLSCAASLGIAVLAAPIARRLRGPVWLRETIAASAAAQLGVAPVLVPVFGSMPLVALPANLLAVPIAGPLTTWGLAAGALGGVLRPISPGIVGALQLPTRLMADAMLGIADAAARAPVTLDAPGMLLVTLLVVVAVLAKRGRMLRRHALVVPPR
jgi:competence protein ComEC